MLKRIVRILVNIFFTTEENKSIWFNKLKEKISKMDYDDFLANVLKTLGIFLLIFFGGGICFLIFKGFTSGDGADYCYIGQTESSWVLSGHRSWSVDRVIGKFENFDLAIEAAKKINCPIEGK
jgi:hypothetical protein